MYGGTSVGNMLIGMNKVESYNSAQVQEIQSNLTNLLHAKKNCKNTECAQLRRFIADYLKHKMTRKNNRKPVRHALPPSGPRPNATAKAKPRNAPPPMGPAPRSATPAGREEAARAAAAENLANRAPPIPNPENEKANNWNAARNLAGAAAAKENAMEPPYTAANMKKYENFLNTNENKPGNFSNTNATVVKNPLSNIKNTKKQIPNNATVVNNPLRKIKEKKNRKTRRNRL